MYFRRRVSCFFCLVFGLLCFIARLFAQGSTKLPDKSFGLDSKLTCACFVSESLVVAGCEDGSVVWLSLASSSLVGRQLLPARVKDVLCDGPDRVICISSSGHVARLGEKRNSDFV